MPNLILALVSILLCCFASLHHACDQFDHDSRLSFSLKISSSPPLNWSSSHDCCLWEGIGCDTVGKITGLWLPSRGLNGVFSPSIWNLTRLSQLNLSHNRLSGPLIVEPFSFSVVLETLDLSYNLLQSELPSFLPFRYIKTVDLSSNLFYGEISDMFFKLARNLASFNVSNNGFTGSIPSSICLDSSFSAVKLLDLSYNDFSCLIPNRLENCSQLQVFRAGFNNLSGSLPQDLYKVITLQEISLPSNGLSGPISNGIANLTNLRILKLYNNQLTGLISQDIGKLFNLEQLLLHINNLTGPLPASLANCTKLVTLNLRVNYLGGDLAAFDFSNLTKLRILDLGENNFIGMLPPTLYSCRLLAALRLSHNRLEGQILPDITALDSLSFLSLSDNNFTNVTSTINILMRLKNLRILILPGNFMNESMPSYDNTGQLDGFQNLQILGLGACLLSGQIPVWLAKLQKLEVLDLPLNQISGSIPTWFLSLPSLLYIDLSSNLISGEFPREINLLPTLASNEAQYRVDATYLQLPLFVQIFNSNYPYNQISYLPPSLYLGRNSLRGNIPVEIGQLKSLHVLDLSNNEFSGSIPSELSKLTNLEKLDLSGNHLTGEIPASFKGLHFLSWFSVANNSLEGPIPSGGQFDTFPVSGFMDNPGLCGLIVQRSCSYQPDTSQPLAPFLTRKVSF